MFRAPLLFWAVNLAAICLASADSVAISEAQPTTLSTTTTSTLSISATKTPDSKLPAFGQALDCFQGYELSTEKTCREVQGRLCNTLAGPYCCPEGDSDRLMFNSVCKAWGGVVFAVPDVPCDSVYCEDSQSWHKAD